MRHTKGQYKKMLLLALIIFCFVILFDQRPAFAETSASNNNPQSTSKEQLQQLDTSQIDKYWDKLVNDYNGFIPNSDPSFKSFVQSNKQGFFQKTLQGMLHYFLNELIVSSKLLGTLILLSVFATVLQAIQSAFEQKAVAKVAEFVVMLALLILLLNSFNVAIDFTKDTVDQMGHFMLALLPLIFGLTAAAGGVTSVAFFHPMIIFLVNMSGWLVSLFIMPLLFLSALLAIVSTLSENYKLTRLSKLMQTVALFTMAAFFAVFLGVMSVQGVAVSLSDGLLVKSAKFFTANFLPVVGRMFTEAADTVLGASVLLKNTVGIAGLIILFCITTFPLLKVLSLAFIYNVASAILQPLGGGPVIDCLGIMAKCMFYLFSALAIVSLMFFLALTIIITSGNVSMMVR
ncbi:stage III sporulation protein AE [Sporolactobacillus spathodeae]|uniref:Stage III sporulation protein AE n=1 Tax=Sporolactobacillus spathodeae TaxID=1465502 RepID=A0ABS2QC08_9BACL|nr:stage III sporulation protein AE [Sporolactobacillus spathodeae]MBM7658689.1 stage III sporulation protein AE [Sporolactobacillus spathodeae]